MGVGAGVSTSTELGMGDQNEHTRQEKDIINALGEIEAGDKDEM